MKRFIESMFAILWQKNEAKSAEAPPYPSSTPALAVRSQVKAGDRPVEQLSLNF
jgi:hypothetical protein